MLVSSAEAVSFRDSEREQFAKPSHPYRFAHHLKGPYAVLAKFTPEESPIEKAELMDFRFNCITQFIPCKNEREILAEGSNLLEVRQ